MSDWEPNLGENFQKYLKQLTFLDAAGKQDFTRATTKILSRCLDPRSNYSDRSLLVIGEVQSGKTASFTGLLTLAQDNGYQIIVLLAGTKISLQKQTTGRLEDDLMLTERDWTRNVVLASKPLKRETHAFASYLSLDSQRVLILICLKTEAGIRGATNVLKEVRNLGVQSVALIIDDEGDQAGLNIQHREGRQSTTYQAILGLREAAGRHSYVAYTATPQANLLLDLADSLSPQSVVVLESRPSYIGGKDLFRSGSPFYRPIPLSEVQIATQPLVTDSPPYSLMASLAYFLVALGYTQDAKFELDPVTMLIHPHSTMVVHNIYGQWINNILEAWDYYLSDPLIADQVINKFLLPARDELRRTISEEQINQVNFLDLENFRQCMHRAIKLVSVRVLNSSGNRNKQQDVNWSESKAWIIIGALKLERGFTIENLTVTYMPRGPGTNTADTIQQRGRFFGHKRKYLALLRGWINPDTRKSFQDYVEHEELMRKELREVDAAGKSLKDWARRFMLDPSMSATRSAVISLPHRRINFTEGWRFRQERLFAPTLNSMRFMVKDDIDKWKARSTPFAKDQRNLPLVKRHHVVAVDLTELLIALNDWPMHRDDRNEFDALLQALSVYAVRQRHIDSHVIFMNNLEERVRSGQKRDFYLPETEWSIDNLHQGRSNNYLGDSFMRTEDAVTVQIHNVVARRDASENAKHPPVFALAVAWPIGFDRALILQRS